MMFLPKILLALFVLVGVSYWDIRYRRIPDHLSLGSFVALLALWAMGNFEHSTSFLLGSLCAFGTLFLLGFVLPGKLGGGDIKLALFCGGIVGFPHWNIALLLACVFGFLTFGIQGLCKLRDKTIPFGPALCLGSLSVLIMNRGVL